MDERVKRLKTANACKRFIKNAIEHDRPDLAKEAEQRAIELKAKFFGADSQAEQECLQAIYAYEEILTRKNGRTTRASRTWQKIKRDGILKAVDDIVSRPQETSGYQALEEAGLEKFAFEVVVLRYPDLFSDEAISRSKERVEDWRRENP